MSLSTAAGSQFAASSFGKYTRSTQPLGVGLVAVLVIAAAIFFLGDIQVERAVIRNAGAEQENDLLRFSEILHYSSVALNGPDARENLPDIARTANFRTNVDRALFGLRAERMDIYTLEGEPVFSTEGIENTPALSGVALEAFQQASRGQFISFLRGESGSRAEFGSDGELLQSFALILDVPPDSIDSGRSLMVASITTDVSSELSAGYSTLWLVVGIFTLGSIVIMLAVHWASVRSRARLQAANDALAEQYVAVRESRERMIAAADATKRAISEELHGNVQTRLFSLWMRLNQLISKSEDGVSSRELEPIIDELDDVRENDIRGLSHRLHPSIVRVGAVPALRSLCNRMSGDVKVDLNVDRATAELEPPGASPIPEPIRLAVFRIAELAIGNTLKHASATHCNVSWSYSEYEQVLRLIVEDDGVGFDADDLTTSEFGGLGIVNIQDYTDSINGSAVLKSEPGWGTTLTVTVPFNPVILPGQLETDRPSAPPSNVTPFDQQKAA